MIRINLTPQYERESQFWWAPDAVALVSAALIAYFLVNYFQTDYQNEILRLQAQNEGIRTEIAGLEPLVQEFNDLEKDIIKLNGKIAAISKITNSKESRHKVVIVMEHLQQLRPQGVWYHSLQIGDIPPGEIELEGFAFDNAIVSELMSALKTTYLIQWDERDLRSHVTFNFVDIKESVLTDKAGTFKDMGEVYQFKLKFNYEIRENGVAVSAMQMENNEKIGSSPAQTPQLMQQNQPVQGH